MDSPKDKLIGVLGAGPVGTILAAALADHGAKVAMVEAAETRRRQLEEDGLRVVGKMELAARPAMVLGSLEELDGLELDALFVCTKTWVLRHILEPLAEALGPGTLVVSFQNGIGPEEDLCRCFPMRQVARGVVNYAGNVDPETGVANLIWFNAPNYLGAMEDDEHPQVLKLATLMTTAGLETQAVPTNDVKKRAFFKSILNASLMPLCASTDLTMKQAMTYAHTRAMAREVLREGLAVGAALGYFYGEGALEQALRYLDAGGDHKPSMWVDLQNVTHTEIEYINGKICKLGQMFSGLDVSANRYLTSTIVTMEIAAGIRDPDDVPDYLIHHD